MDSKASTLYIPEGDWRLYTLGSIFLLSNEFGEIREMDGYLAKTSYDEDLGIVLAETNGIWVPAWRVIAGAFVESNTKIYSVDYIDHDPTNLRVDNLLYLVRREDGSERYIYPRVEFDEVSGRRRYILDGRSGMPIIDLDSGQVYANTYSAAQELGTHQANVHFVVNKKRKRVAGRRLAYLDRNTSFL